MGMHDEFVIVMSDASAVQEPKVPPPLDRGVAVIKVSERTTPPKRGVRTNMRSSSNKAPPDLLADNVPVVIGSTSGTTLGSGSRDPLPTSSAPGSLASLIQAPVNANSVGTVTT